MQSVPIQTFAHLSDLHLRASEKSAGRAAALADLIARERIGHVVLTGDVTHRGRAAELAELHRAFGPLLEEGRLTVLPGNHDRMGDDVATRLARGRVWVDRAPGMRIVCCDSTAPHNRYLLTGQGELHWDDLACVDAALRAAGGHGDLVVLALHHHPRALPADGLSDRIAAVIGWPAADELALGPQLLDLARGRCDVVLHGHRHVPVAYTAFPGDARPLRVYNAGSSTELGGFRVFAHSAGALVGAPTQVAVSVAPALPAPEGGPS
jgi:3',5'-cyclic AMP phosphodiesterase CpdA